MIENSFLDIFLKKKPLLNYGTVEVNEL